MRICLAFAIVVAFSLTPVQGQQAPGAGVVTPAAPVGAALPAGYVIGPEDVLAVVFWREKDWSADVVVRPDGKISLPVLKDVTASGLTPQQLAESVASAAAKYIRDTDVTVIVKEVRSRKVFVVGEVAKPGSFQLGSDMTVLQALAEAGGLLEYANRKRIVIVRSENGRERRFTFNYNEVVDGKRPAQNIKLQPGDTVLVR